MGYIEALIEKFPLNAKFIYEEAFLVVPPNRRLNFPLYLLKQLQITFQQVKPFPAMQ